jgi:hypothetical protein
MDKMNMINKLIPYKTPRQFCEAVSELSAVESLSLTRRPKFRFKPDECSWWLVPSTENPHYKHSKLVFAWEDKKKSKISVGMQIEKGLDEEIKSVYSSKKASRFIMEKSWCWNDFVQLLNEDLFFSKLSDVLQVATELKVSIDGGYVSEPTKFDPYQEKNLGWDQYTFLWNSSDRNKVTLDSVKRSAFVLKLHHVKTISDLQKSLIAFNEDQWLWLNFYVTATFTVSNSNDCQCNSEAAVIWDEYLNKFRFLLERSN